MKMQVELPRAASNEPRWVTRVLRLFPHPIFAVSISFACLLVALIFTMLSVSGGPPAAAIVALGFFAASFFIALATILRRRYRRSIATGTPQGGWPVSHESLSKADLGSLQETLLVDDSDLRGLPPVPTRNLLLYLATVLVWESQIVVRLLRAFGGIQVPDHWRYALTVTYVLLTLLAIRFGWRDLRLLRRSGGKVELTRVQVMLVAAIFVSFGLVGVLVWELVKDKL